MKSLVNALSHSVLAKPFDATSFTELEQLAGRYPYSAAIQLLYAQKLKENDSEAFSSQLQKTLLYFNNPLFISHIINSKDAPANESGRMLTANIVNKDLTAQTEADTLPVTSEQDVTEISHVDEMADTTGITGPAAGTQPVEVLHTETIGPDPGDEEIIMAVPDDDGADLPPLPEFKIETIDPATANFAFTPYHTIDYFAAQGIKLGEEPPNSDRFSAQLKSFTAWLKQMKRLPGANTKTTISISEEKSIEQMALESLSGQNADTEAMAEVWIKQGDIKKAIGIYQKLSLQNPRKSAYFAAKIDHLKK